MDEGRRILTQVLADTDAVWLPNRSWGPPQPQNVYAGRLAFAKYGTPWESGGGNEAERKALQRALEVLAGKKLVLVRRPHRVKTLTVRLSNAADVQARQMIGMPGLRSAWWTCRKVAEHSKQPPSLLPDVWVSETRLIGDVPAGRTWGQEAALVEDMALPALVRGYLVSNADAAGRASYALTTAGWEWVGTPEPPEDLAGPVDAEARDFYGERLQASSGRLDTALSDAREIGDLPLPVSTQGLPVSAAWTPGEAGR